MAPILQAGYPLIFGETGETYDGSECGSATEAQIMGWADAHGVGYEAWTWDTWGGDCLSLITNYSTGTPTDVYAQYVHDHYLTLP
jgi:hypothetical protein